MKAVGWTITGILIASACLCWLLWEHFAPEGESLSTVVRNLALVVGGVIALVLAAWRGVIADSQEATARKSLNNDRFQRAMELLGSRTAAVRYGGYYALGRLAEEEPDPYKVLAIRCLKDLLESNSVLTLEEGEIEAINGVIAAIDQPEEQNHLSGASVE